MVGGARNDPATRHVDADGNLAITNGITGEANQANDNKMKYSGLLSISDNPMDMKSIIFRAAAGDTSALIDYSHWRKYMDILRQTPYAPKSVEGFVVSDGKQIWQDDIIMHLSNKDLQSGIDPFSVVGSYLEGIELKGRDVKLLIIPAIR